MNDELSPAIGDLIHELPADLTTTERVLLANPGPVQTLLSVIYDLPIEVNPLSQRKYGTYGETTVRWIELKADPAFPSPAIPSKSSYRSDRLMEEGHTKKISVALAESVIPNDVDSNPPEFIRLIEEQKLGIGQIIKKLKLITHREVMDFYANSYVIARNYRIYGDCNILITETFFRDGLRGIDV